jgi:hypothetical protein
MLTESYIAETVTEATSGGGGLVADFVEVYAEPFPTASTERIFASTVAFGAPKKILFCSNDSTNIVFVVLTVAVVIPSVRTTS